MNKLIKKRLLIPLGLVLVLLMVLLLVKSPDTKKVTPSQNNTVAEKNLIITVSGDSKYINVSSSNDGDLGTYLAGTVSLVLTKSIHTLTISGYNFASEIITVDLTTSSKSITLNLKDISEVQKIASKYSSAAESLSEKDCTFFADSSWAVCHMNYTADFSETNVFRLENGAWAFVAGGSYLTSDNLDGTGAPTELVNYVREN